MSAEAFESAFWNKDHLESLWVPTSEALDRDVFYGLLSKDIHLVGIIKDPIMADGFLRPGGDFWNHDVRHESAKFFTRKWYIEKNHLNQEQIRLLDHYSSRWFLDLEQEITRISDPELREAVDLLAFNFHHDRGYPLSPSMYLNKSLDSTPYGLYFGMRFGGQGVPFGNPLVMLPKAHAWLRRFWSLRKHEELEIFRRGPGYWQDTQ